MPDKIADAFITETNIKTIIHKPTGTKIPANSYIRTWIDKKGIPYKYEFRSSEYQGYHNPDELEIWRGNAS